MQTSLKNALINEKKREKAFFILKPIFGLVNESEVVFDLLFDNVDHWKGFFWCHFEFLAKSYLESDSSHFSYNVFSMESDPSQDPPLCIFSLSRTSRIFESSALQLSAFVCIVANY